LRVFKFDPLEKFAVLGRQKTLTNTNIIKENTKGQGQKTGSEDRVIETEERG
jgi:hypothetical protein